MFALFEAGDQVIRLYPKPQVTSLRSSPGANHVGPLRGPLRHLGLTVWHLSEVLSIT